MTKKCPNCFQEMADNITYCTECGTKLEMPQQTETVSKYDQDESVGTWYFFSKMLMYAVPIFGWGLCLLHAFTAKNKNKRSFARAILIWLVIGLILGIALYFVCQWIGSLLVEYINIEFGGQFTEIKDILEQLSQLNQLTELGGNV